MAELRATMGQDEYVEWSRWYALKHQREQLEVMKAGG